VKTIANHESKESYVPDYSENREGSLTAVAKLEKNRVSATGEMSFDSKAHMSVPVRLDSQADDENNGNMINLLASSNREANTSIIELHEQRYK
jgi:hypothetical protein